MDEQNMQVMWLWVHHYSGGNWIAYKGPDGVVHLRVLT